MIFIQYLKILFNISSLFFMSFLIHKIMDLSYHNKIPIWTELPLMFITILGFIIINFLIWGKEIV